MKLLIIDGYEIVRKGILAILSTENCFKKIEEASNTEEAMKQLRIVKPDMTLLDINLGNKENGLDIIGKARSEGITTKFVVLTASCRKGDFVRAKALKVEGYILKDSPVEDIVYALKCISKGKKFYDSGVEDGATQYNVQELLTQREYGVLCELGKGLTNMQIAEKLFISENTVKKHISSLLSKLGLTHRTEAALFAAKQWRRKDDLMGS